MPVKSTGLIRILNVPEGEAPRWVRSAWVGLELPCDPFLGLPSEGLDRGVVSDKKVSSNRIGFSVPQAKAIAILKKHKPEAAKWWKNHNFPHANEYFFFAEEEAAIISGVTRQVIREVTEEMMGDPDR